MKRGLQRFLLGLSALCIGLSVAAADYAGKSTASSPRYTFSWPLGGESLQPRGGTTKGAPITLDHEPSSAWQALQEPSITALERDRRAILAMAGTYRVTFDFLEVTPFNTLAKPNPPYQSWGTEKVYVDQHDEKFISLVHILEMRVVQPDGSISEAMVTKHWRQDWQYQPSQIVQYQGHDQWRLRKLPSTETKGSWLQTVYQVDESPRYASVGKWEHSASYSTWLSGETWRPLPRREWSVRSDYHALVGTNRHTVHPTGWVQEENNLKAVLDSKRTLQATRPYLAREYGVARYERIRDADFTGADKYFAATRQFWTRVQAAWSQAFIVQNTITLRGPVDKLGLFMPLFAHADAIASAAINDDAAADQQVIQSALRGMGAIQ